MKNTSNERDRVLLKMLKTPPKRLVDKTERITNESRTGYVNERGSKQRPSKT